MTEHTTWSPEDNYESDDIILSGIQKYIHQHMTSNFNAEYATKLANAIQEKQLEIEVQYDDWIEDEASQFHLRFMSLLLASYQNLQTILSNEDALSLLKKATLEPSQQAIRQSVKYALDNSEDPMLLLINESKIREETFFGKTFTFETIQNDHNGYKLHVKRCFYHRFAVENGVPELMQILCEWDWNWAGAIEPQQHGVTFDLPTTLGYGDDVCRFHFNRI